MFNIFKKIGLAGVFIGILLMSATANAIPIENTVFQKVYMKKNEKNGGKRVHNYTHNLTDNIDFILGTTTAISGNLFIDFWDDGDKNKEKIKIKIRKVQGKDILGSATQYLKEVTVQALLKINKFGKLNIRIKAKKGDFYVGNSVLSIYTNDPSNGVPAPGILGMLGLGLLGIGVAGRIRKT